MDINTEDQSYAASTAKYAKRDNFREDHSYNLESPRTLKWKNQAKEKILQKYRKRLKRQCQKSRRLKRKVSTLKGVTKELRKKMLISNQCASLLKSINEVRKHILWTIQEGKKSAKYLEELKQFATTLQFYSPKAYEYLRDNFQKALPHPGFTVASFTALQSHLWANKEKGKETVCALMMDKMYIHMMTEFARNQFHGFVNIGTGEIDNAMATQALLLMAVNESWKIPIAYFLITGMDGKEKANVIRESLTKLREVGVKVVSLTCDAPTRNLSMIRELGADLNINNMKLYFLHPEDPVHVFLDECHMLKLFWNAFASLLEFEKEDGSKIKVLFSTLKPSMNFRRKKVCDLETG